MPSVTIAHLTDLHCDASDDWDRRFEKISTCLTEIAPSAIAITGDLCESPKRGYFQHLLLKLRELIQRIQAQGEDAARASLHKYVIAVPGNHDVATKGNRIFGLGHSPRAFEDFSRELLKDQFDNVEQQATAFFRDYGVALYPLDSNKFLKLNELAFARGRVLDPAQRFRDMEKRFIEAAADEQARWQRATRIALLHHHPLPLPTTAAEENIEPYNILDNANEFLRQAGDHGIHLLLHGHRHTSGFCRYEVPGKSRRDIAVSSCASSCKPTEDSWELCVLKVSEAGTVERERYVADRQVQEFRLADEKQAARHVVPYVSRREQLSSNCHLYASKYVKRVRSKTKIVRISEDGIAYVTVRYEGIEWMPSVRMADVVLSEFIRIGIGRAVSVVTTWLSKADVPMSQHVLVEPPRGAGGYVEISGKTLFDADAPDGCVFSYIIWNAYSLTTQDHAESYGQNQLLKDGRDWSTVDSIYPTDSLELIVQFPDAVYFPNVAEVSLDCWLGGAAVESENIRSRAYSYDQEEADFLRKEDVVRRRPEVLQLSVRIRHPQCGRGYTLRWPLAKVPDADPRVLREWNLWRGRLLKKSGGLTEEKMQDLEREFGSILNVSDVRMAAYAYDDSSDPDGPPLMRLVYPDSFRETRHVVLPVGRGVVGRAFRSRAPFYFFDRGGQVNPAEPIDGFPDEVTEILALPLIHPVSLLRETAGVPADGESELLQPSKVSGVLILFRTNVTDHDEKLNPERWPNEDVTMAALYQSIVSRFPKTAPAS